MIESFKSRSLVALLSVAVNFVGFGLHSKGLLIPIAGKPMANDGMYLSRLVLAIPPERALGVVCPVAESYQGVDQEEVLLQPCCLLLCLAALLNDCIIVGLFLKGLQHLNQCKSLLGSICNLHHELFGVVFLAGTGKFFEESL